MDSVPDPPSGLHHAEAGDPFTDASGRRTVQCLAQRLHAVARRPLDSRARRWTTVAAGLVFVVVAVMSVRAIGGVDPEPIWLMIAVALTPIIQAGNAVEYRIMGQMLGEDVGWWEALEITTLATAANLLPLPGGTLVRVRELGGRSGLLGSAVLATIVIGVAWLGAALILAAVGLLWLHKLLSACLFASTAIAVLGLAYLIAPTTMPHRRTLLGRLGAVEIVMCGAIAARIAVVMKGIGLSTSLATAMVLSASGAMAAMVGLFPGGIGLRELLAGGLAPLADAAPEAGAAAVAIDRLIGLFAMAASAAAVAIGARAFGHNR